MRKTTVLILLIWLAALIGTVNAQDGSPSITITAPANGAVIADPGAIAVSGTGTALPEGNVVVRALDAAGGILTEQATTTDATEPEGTGNWQVTLAVSVPPGTPGRIYAFSTAAADGSVIAQASVSVTYGQVPQPAITITSIAPGAQVANDGPIPVSGTATNLFEGGLVVRALDSAGNILDEQPTTASGAALGGTGPWEVELNVSVASGTTGRIYAFATSARDGSIEAEASVSVIYGDIFPETPSLTITSPGAGAVLNTASGVAVTGTSANVPEGKLTVQARGENNAVLAEQAVTAGADGAWQATLTMRLTADTAGNIYAFVPNPTGNPLATATVNVTFQANCVIRTDWPTYSVVAGDTLFNIAQKVGSSVNELAQANCLTNTSVIVVGQQLHVPRLPEQPGQTPVPPTATPAPGTPPAESASINFTAPQPNVVIDPAASNTIGGTGTGLAEGNVHVRILTSDGMVLSDALAAVAGDAWQYTLPSTLESGMHATIYAYVTSPTTGGLLAGAAVNVLFGTPEPGPFVTISSPAPYSTLTGGTIMVSGRGGALFEGNVVVQARDNRGNVLTEQATTVNAPDVGGEGEWSVSLTVEAIGGTRGSIRAFSTSAEDGSVVAQAQVAVIFGQPAADAAFMRIDAPLPGTPLAVEALEVEVAGVARGAPNNALTVLVVDEYGNVLASRAVTADATTGRWSTTLTLSEGVMPGAQPFVAAFYTDDSGTVMAGDSITVLFVE
jgi:LysM repeat protein